MRLERNRALYHSALYTERCVLYPAVLQCIKNTGEKKSSQGNTMLVLYAISLPLYVHMLTLE